MSIRPSVCRFVHHTSLYAVCVCKLVIASLRPHHSTIFVTKSRFRNSYAVALNTDSVYMKTHHSRRNTFLCFLVLNVSGCGCCRSVIFGRVAGGFVQDGDVQCGHLSTDGRLHGRRWVLLLHFQQLHRLLVLTS